MTSNNTWNQSLSTPWNQSLGHNWNLNAGTLSEAKGLLSRKVGCETPYHFLP